MLTSHAKECRALARLVRRSMLCVVLMAGEVHGQTTAAPATAAIDPEVGSTLDAETLSKLPLGENVYSLLETTQAEVISDRFNSGGLNAGEPSKVGGILGSWSQTAFRIGDIDISDPSGSGAPLLFPELSLWDRIGVRTGLMPIGFNAPALGIDLTPTRPGPTWTTMMRGSASGGALASSTPTAIAPPISRLDAFGHASAIAAGPLIPDRVGIAAGGSWIRSSKFLREISPAADSDIESGFAHLIYTPSKEVESRTFGWVQRTNVPFEYRQLFQHDASTRDRAVHLQSTIDGHANERLHWRVGGGFTARTRTSDLNALSSITADRLTDGPIPSIADATGHQLAGRWTLMGTIQPKPGNARVRHATELGAALERTFLRTSDQFAGRIEESVDGVPARFWNYSHPNEDSRRHTTSAAVFATDRIALTPTTTVDAGIRFESITGRAEGAATNIGWHTLLPRAVVRWEFAPKTHTAIVGGYRRSANRLNLNLLAFGDPNAETAIVTRVLPAPLAAAAIVDRVGPGTGGNPAFSRVDPILKRPYTDEFVVGIESERRRWLRVGLTGVARREADLIGVVDVGVPQSSYSTVAIPDAGHDLVSSADDQVLTAYNRLPESYARNQYVLINSGEQAATAFALKMWADGSTDKLTVLFGATASMANGSAASRGYGPLENDQDVVGELLTDPNAATFARGRLFSDRAFTIKWTTTYNFPKDVRVGVIARYQDGQPFARLVAVPGLNQGPELIRAYPNAGNRFTFTGTLDIRVQKRIAVAHRGVDAIVDFYNLATRSNEVEEYTVTGPNFRTPTAIEPPRAIHVGFRLTL